MSLNQNGDRKSGSILSEKEIEDLLNLKNVPPEVRERMRAQIRRMEVDAETKAAKRMSTMSDADVDKLAEKWAALDPSDATGGVRLAKQVQSEKTSPRFGWWDTASSVLLSVVVFGGFFYLLYRLVT